MRERVNEKERMWVRERERHICLVSHQVRWGGGERGMAN